MNPPKKIVFVGVDGHGGSGKSTLAVQLGEILAAQIIHTDDFASWDNPLDWWPLLIDRVFRPIADGARSLSYPRSSWWPDHHPQPVTDQPVTDLMILEGVGALRTEFRPYLTFAVFVDTPKDECLQRGFERDRGTGGNDDDQVRAIWEEWYRQEETIMSQYRPQDFADIVVDGTSPFQPQIENWLRTSVVDRTPRSLPPDEKGGIPGMGPTLTR